MSILAQFKGTIYPDKSFSLGSIPRERKKASDKQYERAYRAQEESNAYDLIDWYTGTNSIEGKFCSTSESPLFIKSPKSSQEKRGVYGKHGITNFGRRFVKNACILLEQRYGIRRLGFATATLPDMDEDTCRAINGSISDITRRFYQKIRRKYQKRGCEFIYVGCVEVQEKRFRNTSIPAIHLHFVYLAKNRVHSGYTCNTSDFYTAWNESVNEVLKLNGYKEIMGIGRHIGSVKVEPIRTSAAAYIGKYLSKGIKVVEAMQEKGFTELPKQWWTASMQCKKMFKESLIHLKTKECEAIFYGLEHLLHEGLLTWASFVDILIGDRYVRIGCVGTMSNAMYAMFQDE